MFRAGRSQPLRWPADAPAALLIQQIRDEAHRFAISGHRGQRARTRNRSVLEDIDGLGPKRRQAVLKSLGGLAAVKRASVADLCRVEGISRALAERIYDQLHG